MNQDRKWNEKKKKERIFKDMKLGYHVCNYFSKSKFLCFGWFIYHKIIIANQSSLNAAIREDGSKYFSKIKKFHKSKFIQQKRLREMICCTVLYRVFFSVQWYDVARIVNILAMQCWKSVYSFFAGI